MVDTLILKIIAPMVLNCHILTWRQTFLTRWSCSDRPVLIVSIAEILAILCWHGYPSSTSQSLKCNPEVYCLEEIKHCGCVHELRLSSATIQNCYRACSPDYFSMLSSFQNTQSNLERIVCVLCAAVPVWIDSLLWASTFCFPMAIANSQKAKHNPMKHYTDSLGLKVFHSVWSTCSMQILFN